MTGFLSSSYAELAAYNAPAAAPCGRLMDATSCQRKRKRRSQPLPLVADPLVPPISQPQQCWEARPPLLNPQRTRQTTQPRQPVAFHQPSLDPWLTQPKLPAPPLQPQMPPSLRQPMKTPQTLPPPHPSQPWPLQWLPQPHPCILW
jgi:hypothetical protein